MRVRISPNAQDQKHDHEILVEAVLMKSVSGVDHYIHALQVIRDMLWKHETNGKETEE
jgi:hypothetical protein